MYELLGEVTFSEAKQNDFASLSGDYNPLHIDPIAARRTSVGRPIVHGAHVMLASLEMLAPRSEEMSAPLGLEVRFIKPVYVHDSLQILVEHSSHATASIRVEIEGEVVADLRLSLGGVPTTSAPDFSPVPVANLPCRELTAAEMLDCSGSVPCAVTTDVILFAFPRTSSWIGVERVAALLCLSRLVGMECPGLHSLLSGFKLEFNSTAQSSLQYEVEKFDRRFALLKIRFCGLGVQGDLEAFTRNSPVAQPRIQELASLVRRGEFSGTRALIVGGSRGLGELTAKLLAAGGCDTVITHCIGEADAQLVAEEIRQWGGRCATLRYNVENPPEAQLLTLSDPISHLYYYATCQISARRTRVFGMSLLKEFLRYYAQGFYDLCAALQNPERPLSVFYPSSVYVEGRPRDLTEYGMAKAAGEVLCSDLNREWPNVKIFCERLPRLHTDQTNSFTPTYYPDSVDVLLPIIRRVQGVKLHPPVLAR